MSPTLIFIGYILYLALLLMLGMAIGLVLFAKVERWNPGRVKRRFMRSLFYVVVLLLILVAVGVKNIAADTLHLNYVDFTPGIDAMEDGFTTTLQKTLESVYMTDLMTFSYIYLFVFILFFTPFLFIYENKVRAMKAYTLTLLIAYCVLIPLYLFFPVYVTSYSNLNPNYIGPGGTQPLLYTNPNHLRLVWGIDRLDDCFPSSHMAIAIAVLLSVWRYTNFRRYTYVCLISAMLIALSALYLGIHWLLDLIAGAVLSLLSFAFASMNRVRDWYESLNTRFHRRIKNPFGARKGYKVRRIPGG